MKRIHYSERGMRRVTMVFLAASLVCLLVPAGRAEAQAENHAKVELIAEQDSIQPSHSLWAGLLFRLDRGWHVYWQNPGDSGEPPRVQWELPAGFRAGAIEWPNPIRLGSESVVDYGYEGHVLLMVRIKAPPALRATGGLTIAADVKYIVCREICIPGKAHLSLSLPRVGGGAGEDPERHSIFEQTRGQLPRRAPAEWKISAVSEGNHFVLSVRCNLREQKISFLPLDAGEVENSAPQSFIALNDGFQLTLQKSNLLVKPVKTLRGLIVMDNGSTIAVAAPVVER
jgi:DsbC/DsbD-like thiol-disulfide interchange protein